MIQTDKKLALSVADAADKLSIGRTVMFDLLRTNQIRSVKVGRRRIIPVDALNEYLQRLASEQSA